MKKLVLTVLTVFLSVSAYAATYYVFFDSLSEVYDASGKKFDDLQIADIAIENIEMDDRKFIINGEYSEYDRTQYTGGTNGWIVTNGKTTKVATSSTYGGKLQDVKYKKLRILTIAYPVMGKNILRYHIKGADSGVMCQFVILEREM